MAPSRERGTKRPAERCTANGGTAATLAVQARLLTLLRPAAGAQRVDAASRGKVPHARGAICGASDYKARPRVHRECCDAAGVACRR